MTPPSDFQSLKDSGIFFNKAVRLSKSFMDSRVFLTAVELGIFKAIGNRQMTSRQIAETLEADCRGTEILLNALTAIGLLQKSGHAFSNHKAIADMFSAGSPRYQEGLFRHTANLYENWSHLTEIVRSGRTSKPNWSGSESRDLALAMQAQAKPMAVRLAREIDASRFNRMLDLGSGPGSYGIAFAKCYSGLEVVLFEQDREAINLALQEISREGLDQRVQVKSGDFMNDGIGKNYDLILLSSIICLFGKKDVRRLLDKAYRSLSDGGKVVVHDTMLDASKTKPAASALFAVNMLVQTPNGRAYALPEVKELLQSTGFKNISHFPFYRSTVIAGSR